jgi:ABC-type branched-subunit amino acid transport system ATPase component
VLSLNQFLSLQRYTGYVFGGLLLVFVLFAPRGLVPTVGKLRHRDNTGRSAASAPAGEQVTSTPGRTSARADVLRIIDARRQFGGVKAVDGVSVAVQRGTLTGLIGSNGSGKTTLLNLISGFYRLDRGSVETDQTVLSSKPPYLRARSGVSRTFQTPKLMERESVLVNVMVGADMAVPCSAVSSVLRLPGGRRARRAAESASLAALDRLGLGDAAARAVGELPHGTRRLVELARAIATQPSFLLVDEPAAGLSEAELQHLSLSLAELAGSGIGVLLIEHNVPMVLGLASQVTALHQGGILFQGTPEELRADQDVASAFLGSAAAAEVMEEAENDVT